MYRLQRRTALIAKQGKNICTLTIIGSLGSVQLFKGYHLLVHPRSIHTYVHISSSLSQYKNCFHSFEITYFILYTFIYTTYVYVSITFFLMFCVIPTKLTSSSLLDYF